MNVCERTNTPLLLQLAVGVTDVTWETAIAANAKKLPLNTNAERVVFSFNHDTTNFKNGLNECSQ